MHICNPLTAPEDFSSVVSELTFGPNNGQSTVNIPIVNDIIYEDEEVFFASLELITTGLSVRVEPNESTIRILDNDGRSN